MDTTRDRKWAITIDGADEPVGFVALFGLDRELGPELAVLVGDPAAWGKGVAREAERQACNARLRRARRPPHPRRDPGHQRGGAEGRHVPRLPARGRDARGDPPRRRARSTTRSGACSPRTSPAGRSGGEAPSAVAELIADRGAAAAQRRLLPLPRLPRRRGRHPHAADPRRRGRRSPTADRPRDPRLRAPRRDLAVRLSRAAPSRAPGPRPGGRSGRLVGHRAGERLRARAPRRGAVARGRRPSARGCWSHDPACPRSLRAAARRADPRQPPSRLERRGAPRPARRPSRARGLRRGLHRDDAPRAGAAERYFFARSYLDAALSYERSWLAGRRAGAASWARRRSPPQRLRPALLPRRHRRRRARALAVQERGRGDARPRRRARPAAQPRRRAGRGRRARGVQARLRQRQAGVLHAGGGLRPGPSTSAWRRVPAPAPSSRPTARSALAAA